jgi:hypothetical protein
VISKICDIAEIAFAKEYTQRSLKVGRNFDFTLRFLTVLVFFLTGAVFLVKFPPWLIV